MFVDLPEHELREYQGSAPEPSDFDEFWSTTLAAQAHPTNVRLSKVDSPVRTVDLYDVAFDGYGGGTVHAWLRVPAGAEGPLPAVVEYVGYGGGRGFAEQNLLISSSGFVHLHMDTRGQGATWSVGATQDDGPITPAVPGFMTRGIGDPHDYYYRRLFVDAVRAVSVAKELPMVDADRVGVQGMSQGGGVALAVAGLRHDVGAAVSLVPFLCDIRRATTITDAYPYKEIATYLSVHRTEVARAERTLSYFDGINFARRATAPVMFSAALMDPVCPPSTVFAAYNNYAGPKTVNLWPYNAHEGGGISDDLLALEHFRRTL